MNAIRAKVRCGAQCVANLAFDHWQPLVQFRVGVPMSERLDPLGLQATLLGYHAVSDSSFTPDRAALPRLRARQNGLGI
jgi:hypothetical protein